MSSLPTSLRCSAFAREVGLNPAGTAGSYEGFLLVEHPLPWPRDVADDPLLGEVCQAARHAGYRVQAMVPVVNGASMRTVIHFRKRPGPFRRYERSEHRVAPGQVVDLCRQLMVSDPALSAPTQLDVLVCGHGRRDRCCGSMGTALLAALSAAMPADGGDGHVSLRRTSHTGGHRFAPTAIVFPEATMWAYLDADALTGIVNRMLPAADAAARYRGCAGLGGPEVQALDAAVLAELGWEWLGRDRLGTVVSVDGDVTRVRIEYDAADGRRGYEADVRVRRVLPVPDCGKPITEAKKSEPEYEVGPLTQLG